MRNRIWIPDPYQSEKLDLDPHQSEKSDQDPHQMELQLQTCLLRPIVGSATVTTYVTLTDHNSVLKTAVGASL